MASLGVVSRRAYAFSFHPSAANKQTKINIRKKKKNNIEKTRNNDRWMRFCVFILVFMDRKIKTWKTKLFYALMNWNCATSEWIFLIIFFSLSLACCTFTLCAPFSLLSSNHDAFTAVLQMFWLRKNEQRN